MNPEAVVQRQLDAYNAHDLERFLAEYDDEIRAFRLPSTVPVLDGKAAFGRFYATQRFNLPHLHAILVNRMVLGSKVVDHERIVGVRAEVFEVAVVYEIVGGVIRCTWSHAAES